MKNIYIYSHQDENTSAFYLEGRGGQWQGGIVHGSREAAFLTGLISFFAWRGPESTIIFGHPEQKRLIEDFDLWKNNNLNLDGHPERRLWKRFDDCVREYKFLLLFRIESQKQNMNTERLKSYARQIIDRSRK